MNQIRFSHRYRKMPTDEDLAKGTVLVSIQSLEKESLHPNFLNYDTSYGDIDIFGDSKHYPLPEGRVLLLLLLTNKHLWCTIRSYTPGKEAYYYSMVGKPIEIVISK